jgi:hypothetical protein
MADSKPPEWFFLRHKPTGFFFHKAHTAGNYILFDKLPPQGDVFCVGKNAFYAEDAFGLLDWLGPDWEIVKAVTATGEITGGLLRRTTP